MGGGEGNAAKGCRKGSLKSIMSSHSHCSFGQLWGPDALSALRHKDGGMSPQL